MKKITHYHWNNKDQGGRIAVKLDDRFQLKVLTGAAPPAGILHKVLSEKDFRYAVIKHYKRKNSFFVEERIGMSGCKDLLLRVCRNKDWDNYPITAYLHISMFEKLNEDVDIFFMDLIPLLEKISYDEKIEVNEVDKFQPDGDWINLKETITEKECDAPFHGESIVELRDSLTNTIVGVKIGYEKMFIQQAFKTDFFVTPNEIRVEKWRNIKEFLNYRNLNIIPLSGEGWYVIDVI